MTVQVKTAGEVSPWSAGFKLPESFKINTLRDNRNGCTAAAKRCRVWRSAMPSGGARNRSGPQPDPNSLKSAKRGLSLTALPASGYDGEIPAFPLEAVPIYDIWFVDKERHKELNEEATEARHDREQELWDWAWHTPQAAAWASEAWRQHAVALWVRTAAICEGPDATAADKNSLHRFADQIGLTPAGLAFNGWKIAADQLAEKRAEKAPAPSAPSARDRMKAVRSAAAGQ